MIKTHRNQEPEPVRPWFARLFRRPAPAAPSAPPSSGRAELVVRLAKDLTEAREEAERWKRHADEFAALADTATREHNELALDAEQLRKDLDGAYRERAQLLAWITALHPATSVITQSPDVDEDGWQLLYLVAGGWQMSWHIHPRDTDLFRHVTVVDVTDVRAQWDGHGTEQKYERIHNHVRLLALDELGADGAVTGVVTGSEVRSA
ncbi:hypothetical protein [Streptomyces sp. NPDC096142]|uniref:hypothetical protein n=1 Tax=Streptomyces sp. NPDC096142 TaxID=3366077 RepID=UPI0038065A69